MIYAFVTINRGIIGEVLFYFSEKEALEALDRHVKNMNPEYDDAAVYSQDEMVANAKTFLDENEEYDGNALEELLNQGDEIHPIYIIGNPCHNLGFMVASPDDPLGYKNPAEAISDLGQMRKDHGNHLKLYRVVRADGPVTRKSEVLRTNGDNEVDDFDYPLVDEYMDPN